MANTYSSNLKMPEPAFNDRGWNVAMLSCLNTIDQQATISNLAVTTSEVPSATLNISIAAGSYTTQSNTVGSYAGISGYAVPANAYTYLWLTDSGTLTTGTAWPSGVSVVRLAIVNAGASTITGIADARIVNQSIGYAISAPVTSKYVTIGSDSTLPNSRALTGTAKQVIVTDGGSGNPVTLSTPQNIDTTAVPTFAGTTLTGPLARKGLTCAVTTVSGNYTAQVTDDVIRVNAANAAITITLPSATSNQVLRIKKIDSSGNAVTISSSSQIDGAGSITITAQYNTRTLIADSASGTWGIY